MKKYRVCLCRECINDLKNHVPFTIPLDMLEITETESPETCDNITFNDIARNKDFIITPEIKNRAARENPYIEI